MRALIEQGRVAACHDVSDGGLLVALAEMAMAGGSALAIEPPDGTGAARLHAWLFGEDQGRYVIEVTAEEAPRIRSGRRRPGCRPNGIGTVGGARLTLRRPSTSYRVESLRAAHEGVAAGASWREE